MLFSARREILFEGVQDMAMRVGYHVENVLPSVHLASQNSMCALQIGPRVLGIYESHLPVRGPPQMATKMWSQPIFLCAMLVMGFWQYNRMKRPDAGGMQMPPGIPGFGGMGGMDGMGGMGGMGGGGGMPSDLDITRLARSMGADPSMLRGDKFD